MRILIALFLLLSLPTFSKVIDVDETTDYLSLADHIWVYKSDSAISLNQFDKLDWKPTNGTLNFGIVGKPHFFRVLINNKGPKEITKFFYLPFHHIERIEVFNKDESIALTGTKINNDDFRFGSGYGIETHLKPGLNELYIKINHLHQPLRVGAYLLKEDSLNRTVRENENLLFFWKGIFFFALVLSITLFGITKLNTFLYYFLLYFGVGIFISVEIGDFITLFGSDNNNLILDIKHLGNVLCMLYFPRFVNELSGLSTRLPKIWKFFDWTILAMIPMFFIGLIPGVKETPIIGVIIGYYVAISGIVFIAQLFFLVYGVVKKVPFSIELLLIYFVYIPSVFIDIILPNAGVQEGEILVYKNIVYVSIAETILFLFIVSKQTIQVFRERNELRIEQKSTQLKMVRSIIENQEAERDRIGRELHDMVGGNISIIKQSLKTEDEKLRGLFEDTVESVRNLSHGLVTPDLRKGSFEEEIKDLVQISSGNSINFRCNFFDWPTDISEEISKNLYRIVQELIQNALKHSGSNKVFLQFYGGDKLRFFYEDNGVGAKLNSIKRGRGLDGIENRVKVLQGELSINTQPNSGFEISIRI